MELILNNLIKATGWSIFHSLWQGAIIYGVLLLLVNTFPRMQARSKHNIAYGGLIFMFLSFAITFATIFKMPVFSQQIDAETLSLAGLQPEIYESTWSTQLNKQAETLFPYLVPTYAIGLLIQLFVLSNGYLRLRKLRNGPHEEVPADWQKTFMVLIAKMGLSANVRFQLSSYVNVPLVIGYLKPIVLFPVALTSQLDIHQVEAILIHELSHIRRNDYLLNLFKTAIETILFFNPFVWLSSKLINIEREHACDDLVLKLTGTPVTYAHALLKLEILKEKSSPALAMASTGKDQHLYQRIKRITNMKTNYMNAKQQLFAVTLTVATVISLAWVSPQKDLKLAKHSVEISNVIVKKVSSIVSNTTSESKIDTIPKEGLKMDTLKRKGTLKIVTVDRKGNKVVRSADQDLSDSVKLELFKANNLDFNFNYNGTAIDSALANQLSFLSSPEFCDKLKNLTDAATSEAALKKYQNLADYYQVYLNSPEWKEKSVLLLKSQAALSKKLSEEIKEAQQSSKKLPPQLQLRYYYKEYDKQQEALKELQGSEEYKRLKEKFEKEVEQLKEKKGIKSDLQTEKGNFIDLWPSTLRKF